MLAEVVEYLMTPCGVDARKMGYLSAAIAVRHRHRRCRESWQPHLDRCRSVILRAAEGCPRRRRALVIGSGLLLEVPLEELARDFAEVVLVDIVHLAPVRRRARRCANVRLVELDVTGTAAALRRRAGTGGPLPAAAAPALGPGGEVDLAVSANLLSQLPLVPLDWLARLPDRYGEAELAAFARGLIEAHVAWLRALGGVACLITDAERLITDGPVEGAREDALFGAQLPGPDEEWWWNIAPRPERYRDRDVLHRVIAFADLNRAAAGG